MLKTMIIKGVVLDNCKNIQLRKWVLNPAP
jgi:hypothetical protein